MFYVSVRQRPSSVVICVDDMQDAQRILRCNGADSDVSPRGWGRIPPREGSGQYH